MVCSLFKFLVSSLNHHFSIKFPFNFQIIFLLNHHQWIFHSLWWTFHQIPINFLFLFFLLSSSFFFLLSFFLLAGDPRKPKPTRIKLLDAPAKGILKKAPRQKKLSVRFDLPYVASTEDPSVAASASAAKSDEEGDKPKVFIKGAGAHRPSKSSQYLGLELYQYYSSLCTRKGIQPWDKLLQQIKVAPLLFLLEKMFKLQLILIDFSCFFLFSFFFLSWMSYHVSRNLPTRESALKAWTWRVCPFGFLGGSLRLCHWMIMISWSFFSFPFSCSDLFLLLSPTPRRPTLWPGKCRNYWRDHHEQHQFGST